MRSDFGKIESESERRERGDSQNRDSSHHASRAWSLLDLTGGRDTGGLSDRAGRRQAEGATTAQEPAVPCMADRERVARGMQQRGCMGFHDGVRGSRGEDEGGRCPGHSLVRMGGAGVVLARRDPAIV